MFGKTLTSCSFSYHKSQFSLKLWKIRFFSASQLTVVKAWLVLYFTVYESISFFCFSLILPTTTSCTCPIFLRYFTLISHHYAKKKGGAGEGEGEGRIQNCSLLANSLFKQSETNPLQIQENKSFLLHFSSFFSLYYVCVVCFLLKSHPVGVNLLVGIANLILMISLEGPAIVLEFEFCGIQRLYFLLFQWSFLPQSKFQEKNWKQVDCRGGLQSLLLYRNIKEKRRKKEEGRRKKHYGIKITHQCQ